MWPPRHDKQLEITTNIGVKGCAVGCIVCPQEKLYTTYNLYPDRVKHLSFENFKKSIDKVPLSTRIDFSGYAEPYLNPNCTKMIRYAHDKGHTVCVYTTLVGANKSDVDYLLELCQHPTRPFSAYDQENPLAIHLPDEGGVMPIKLTKKYFDVLEHLIKNAQRKGLGLGTHVRFMTMDPEGVLSKDLIKFFPGGKIPFKFKAISRASNLDDTQIGIQAPTMTNYEGGIGRKPGKIFCKSNSLKNNVLIPNGDVQLCCMDYGLEAKVANLLSDDYDEIFNGPAMQDIISNMSDINGSDDLLCRRCENAVYKTSGEDMGIEIKTRELQDTLNILYTSLSTKSKVYYSRFGDGDFSIMQGKKEMMHDWSPDLQKELQESFAINDELYLKGTMFNEPTFDGNELVHHPPETWKPTESFIKNNFKDYADFTLDSHVLLTYIAIHEQDIMNDFLNNFIRPKKKLFIGSVDKTKIERLVGHIDYYVKIPKRDAYYSIDEWWPKVLECVDDVDLVIPTAGMAGRVINKRLWNLGKDIHSIELGSIVDAVTGNESRSWIGKTKDKINNILQ